jgi:hypothetical protein
MIHVESERDEGMERWCEMNYLTAEVKGRNVYTQRESESKEREALKSKINKHEKR